MRDVHQQMLGRAADDPAYNTVQTLLRLMEGKKLVSHHVEGRTFIYTPRFSRNESAARFVERVFDGAPSQLVLSLLEEERISPHEIEQLYALIAAAQAAQQIVTIYGDVAMSLNETMLGHWWLHSAIGGGLLLLLVGVLMAVTRQPARRQRLGEWGVTAALIVAVLCLAPAWLLVPLPEEHSSKPPAAPPSAAVAERPAPAPAALPRRKRRLGRPIPQRSPSPGHRTKPPHRL